MRKKAKKNPSPAQAIASTLERHHEKHLPAVEASLASKVRRRLAPDEDVDGSKYDRCFRSLKKALSDDKRAIRCLFELDEAVGGLIEAQGQISRAVGAATEGLSLARSLPAMPRLPR